MTMTTIESMRATYVAMLDKWSVYVNPNELNAYVKKTVGPNGKPKAYIEALKTMGCLGPACQGTGTTPAPVNPANGQHNHMRCYKCRGTGRIDFRAACREYAYRNRDA